MPNAYRITAISAMLDKVSSPRHLFLNKKVKKMVLALNFFEY